MGELLRQYGPPALAWVVLLARRPGDDHARRYVRHILLGLAISLTVLTPAGHAAVNGLAGTHDLPRLIGHAGMLLTAWAGLGLLLHVNGMRRRWHTWWLAGAFCVMCVFFALTPNIEPASPWVFEYVLAYVLAQLPVYAAIMWLGLRYARLADTTALRVALRMVVAGTAIAAVYLVNKAVLSASYRVGFADPFGHTSFAGKVLPTTAYLLVLIGAPLPAAVAWLGRYRRFLRLGPLWRALYRADPAIALDPPSVPDFLVLGRLRLRLYRRVIEIRDGLLALRPYRDPAVAATARDRATRAGLTGPEHDAAVEAAVVAAALRARAEGRTPRGDGETAVTGGADLAGETEFLGRVARAYRTLPRETRAAQRV
ncbi:MAB_1171c family putative transporter [Actinophytocola sp. KF-1]